MSADSHDQVLSYEEWKLATDLVLSANYAIDTEDAGIDGCDLRRFWADGETPREFVARWARKYDLTHVQEHCWMPHRPIL